jgi:hypothetical protein
MTPASFLAWRVRLYGERGVTAAAKALGCSRTSVQTWEQGGVYVCTGDGQILIERNIPVYISLSCAAIEAGIEPAV